MAKMLLVLPPGGRLDERAGGGGEKDGEAAEAPTATHAGVGEENP